MKKAPEKNAEREVPSCAVMGQIVLPGEKPEKPKKPAKRKK